METKFRGFGLGFMWGIIAGVFFASFVQQAHDRTLAIDANVAEWRIDPKTGDRTFHFLTNTNQ